MECLIINIPSHLSPLTFYCIFNEEKDKQEDILLRLLNIANEQPWNLHFKEYMHIFKPVHNYRAQCLECYLLASQNVLLNCDVWIVSAHLTFLAGHVQYKRIMWPCGELPIHNFNTIILFGSYVHVYVCVLGVGLVAEFVCVNCPSKEHTNYKKILYPMTCHSYSVYVMTLEPVWSCEEFCNVII